MFTTAQRDWVTSLMDKMQQDTQPAEDGAGVGIDEIDILLEEADAPASDPKTGNTGGIDEIDVLLDGIDGPQTADPTSESKHEGGTDANVTAGTEDKGDDPPAPVKTDGLAPPTSCLILVVNHTEQALSLDDQQNEVGDFMTNPASEIAPGDSAQFVYVGTAQSTVPGGRGSCTYTIGEPATGTWRLEWANPLGDKNTASGLVVPTTLQLGSLQQIGQGDENVPATFTLSGAGGGGPPIGPVPVQPPADDPPFTPPAGAKEPTLRQGDKSPDGWVEYLQQALSNTGEQVTIDGSFGPGTSKAVLSFQKKRGLKVDGIVGNQTWAALRGEAPLPPSTDGRAPHSFEESGQEARFFTQPNAVSYNGATDRLTFMVVSVGDAVKLDGRSVTVQVTPPGGKPRTIKAPIVNEVGLAPTGQGTIWEAPVEALTATYPSEPPGAPGSEYLIDAYLDPDLGNDRFTGKPTAAG